MVKTKKAVPALLASVVAMSMSFAGEHDQKPNRCKGPTLCHHNPMNDGSGFFLDIGFIYEQARVSGTEYAHTNTWQQTWEPPQHGTVLRPKFGMDWGLILGAGYLFEHDNWVGTVNFNYFNPTANDCNVCSCSDAPYYVPDCIWCHDLLDVATNVDPAYTTTAPSVSLEIKYYMLEAELGRGSYLSRYMSFEPAFGIKTVWLEFNEHACFKDVVGHYNCCANQTGLATLPGVKLDAINFSKFWGIGPQVSFDTNWVINTGNDACCDSTFALFADFDAALLVGRTQSYTELEINNGDPIIYMKNDYNLMSPTLRVVIGLSSERAFYDNEQHVRARIGWDNVVYFNQFGKTCYSGICDLSSHENNTFSLTGLLFDVAWSF